MTMDPEWESLLRSTRATDKTLGIASESYVERLSDEFRRDQTESRESDPKLAELATREREQS